MPSSPLSDGEIDAFLRLCCLDYRDWDPSHAAQARALLDARPALGGASLYSAAAVGDVEAARALLARDPALTDAAGGPHGWPPLLYACYSRLPSQQPGQSTLPVARLLLEAGADPNAGFLWDGNLPPFTALTGAFGQGEGGNNQPPHAQALDLARLLLEAGADPNDGQTLYNCQWSGADDHLRLLLEYGLGKPQTGASAGPNPGPWYVRFGDRLTSPAQLLADELWSAAHGNRAERVKLLVQHGAELDRPTSRTRRHQSDGATAYQAALMAGNREIAEYLAAQGAHMVALDPERAFASACLAGDRAQAREILARHPGIQEALGDHRRAQLVHTAVATRRREGVSLLAELGFNLSGMTRNTAMHDAAWAGDLEMVTLLVELGADPTIREPTHGATPLGWAQYNHQQAVVDYLTGLAPSPPR